MEFGDLGADGFDNARKLHAENIHLGGTKQTTHESDEKRIGFSESPIRRANGCRVDADQHFIFFGNGFGDVLDSENFGWAVLVINGGFHASHTTSAA